MLYIKDIKKFLLTAKNSGYELVNNFCIKYLYFKDGYDEIRIDLRTGKIEYIQWINNIKYYPEKNYIYQFIGEIKDLIIEKHLDKII